MVEHKHPITPPLELVRRWIAEIRDEGTPVRVAASDLHITTQSARWGADQELDACIEWLWKHQYDRASVCIRAARRPKPPSLAEKGLSLIDQSAHLTPEGRVTIRRALERLQHLEQESNDN